MNVIEILWKLGYDILSISEEGEYKIKFSVERKERYRNKIKKGIMTFNRSLDDEYLVKVGDVNFNDTGNLFVEFLDVNTNEIIDTYEYKNMSNDELF